MSNLAVRPGHMQVTLTANQRTVSRVIDQSESRSGGRRSALNSIQTVNVFSQAKLTITESRSWCNGLNRSEELLQM